MVAGKNTAPSLKKVAAAPVLPPLPKLRVRRPNSTSQNPCIGIMSTMLGCWASSGQSAQACASLEQELRTCMDGSKPRKVEKSQINQHLSRLYPQIMGPTKKK